MTPPPHEAIRNLLGRYCELIDLGDFSGVGDLLGGAVLRDEAGNEIARGRDAIAALYATTTRRHSDGTPRTRHITPRSPRSRAGRPARPPEPGASSVRRGEGHSAANGNLARVRAAVIRSATT